jgi:hypothetical protein
VKSLHRVPVLPLPGSHPDRIFETGQPQKCESDLIDSLPVVIHSFASGFTDKVLPDFNREYHRSGTRFDSNSIIDRRVVS